MSVNNILFHLTKVIFVSLVFTAVSSVNCISQDEFRIEEVLENVSQDSEESEDLEMIEFLRLNPIDLYKASASDITQIPNISLIQAKRIVKFLDKYHSTDFATIADSTGLTPHQEILLENCSFLKYKKVPKKPHFFWRARNQNFIQSIRGIEENAFVGNSLDIYNRLIYSGKNVSAGLLTNKDTGEENLAEFISFFAQYKNENIQIIAGDYSLEYGLGSVLWRSFGARKGAEVIGGISQLGRGIRPYRSSIETNFFRGASANFKFGDLSISGWFSNIDRAAGIDSVKGIANSIYVTGLFRTENEVSKKNKLNESMYGADLNYSIGNLIFGINANYFQYEKPIESISSRYFSGDNGMMSSIYGLFADDNFLIAGERALDAKGNISYKANIEANIEDISFAATYRYFPAEFRSPYGYKFGESSYAANEEGIYAALRYKGINNITSSIYADLYHSLYSTYTLPLTLKGVDLFNETIIKLNSKEQFTVRLRYEDKTDNYKDDNLRLEHIYQKVRLSSRFEYRAKINRDVILRFRIEGVRVELENDDNESGYAGFAEFNWQIAKILKIGSRIAYFSTDSFDSAVWLFEYAMPGFMTTNALYGDGIRSFIYLRFSPLRMLDLWVRYTNTTKNNVQSLGSGWNEITGNRDGRIYFQIDAAF